MTNPPVPARLTVLLARSADVGVILRRGPSKWVRMIRWDTSRDVFLPGQWLNGRVDDCPLELSPDGTKLVYFASNFKPGARHPMWTAVSKPPYFTALAFWPYSYGWDAGGEFVDDRTLRRTYWQDARPPPPPDSRVVPELQIDARPRGDALPRSWDRVGWSPTAAGVVPVDPAATAWRKPNPNGRGELCLRFTYGDPSSRAGRLRRAAYEYAPISGSRSALLDRAEWADWDRRGRLVFAAAGKVYAANVSGPRPMSWELIDLNPMTPEPVEPPASATRW